MRRVVGLGFAASVALSTGCASTWDAVSSRQFRADPFGRMFKPSEDPVEVLRRADPAEGNARARALQALDAPGGASQDDLMQILSTSATEDLSPWVRVCAIDALGRSPDPRAPEILANAYHRAIGTDPTPEERESAIQQVGVRPSARTTPDRLAGLIGVKGFSPDQVANLRAHAVDALAKTGSPEAVAFLARVAAGQEPLATEDPDGHDLVRRRAVAGLGTMQSPEAVQALAQVMALEQGRDVALVNLAHTGLRDLTGKDLPADPAAWQQVVPAAHLTPAAPSPIQQALETR